MIKNFVAAILALLVTSCVVTDYPVYITEETEPEVVILREYEPLIKVFAHEEIDPRVLDLSLAQWEEELRLTLFELVEEEADAEITFKLVERVYCGHEDGNFAGCATGNIFSHGRCSIRIKEKNNFYIPVYVHEAGHCLGLPHDIIELENSIMTPYINPFKFIEDYHVLKIEDLLQIRAEEHLL